MGIDVRGRCDGRAPDRGADADREGDRGQLVSWVGRLIYALRVRLLDASFHPVVGCGSSIVVFLVSRIVRPVLPGLSLSLLCRAHSDLMRVGQSGFYASRLNGLLERTIRRSCSPGELVEHVNAGQTRRISMDRAAMVAGKTKGPPDRSQAENRSRG